MASWTSWGPVPVVPATTPPTTTGGMSPVSGGVWLADHTQNIFFTPLVQMIDFLSAQAVSKIANIRSKKSSMSIADMFDLQMSMNKLTQFTEMSTDVVSAVNTSANSISRNIKG